MSILSALVTLILLRLVWITLACMTLHMALPRIPHSALERVYPVFNPIFIPLARSCV